MSVGVNHSGINGPITCNRADSGERGYRINPRGEVSMAPQPAKEAPTTPQTDEEEIQKKQIFASYIERRVL